MLPVDASKSQPAPGRLPSGIGWFDRITSGGIPKRRLTVVLGQSGAGKTLLSCQIAAGRNREHGGGTVFVALEEPPEDIIRNSAGFTWDLSGQAGQGFHALDLRPDPDTVFACDFDLRGLLATISAKTRQTGADLGWTRYSDGLANQAGGRRNWPGSAAGSRRKGSPASSPPRPIARACRSMSWDPWNSRCRWSSPWNAGKKAAGLSAPCGSPNIAAVPIAAARIRSSSPAMAWSR
jgi:hypothetical protein